MTFSPKEVFLWSGADGERHQKASDREINERYSRGEGRIVIETNREKLPGFVSAMKVPNYMELRPFYQRRPRWKPERQSLLIESFIMNIPVPPVFLFEREYNSYEVMDGQQRITALKEFYGNEFELSGLQMWPELNGRRYETLPEKIRAGLDRRSITSIVLLKESTADEEEASFVREIVFERLNTGGVALSHQEIRNALYGSKFNRLLYELSQDDSFRDIWGIPRYVENEIEVNPAILENTMFSQMADLEVVLRFFTLRHVEHFKRGMQGFMDIYMRKASSFDDDDIEVLRQLYVHTLSLVREIYGDKAFRPFSPERGDWESKPHRAFYDAVMVAISQRLDRREEMLSQRDRIVALTAQLFGEHEAGTFTGRGNTKKDVQNRIALFGSMLDGAL